MIKNLSKFYVDTNQIQDDQDDSNLLFNTNQQNSENFQSNHFKFLIPNNIITQVTQNYSYFNKQFHQNTLKNSKDTDDSQNSVQKQIYPNNLLLSDGMGENMRISAQNEDQEDEIKNEYYELFVEFIKPHLNRNKSLKLLLNLIYEDQKKVNKVFGLNKISLNSIKQLILNSYENKADHKILIDLINFMNLQDIKNNQNGIFYMFSSIKKIRKFIQTINNEKSFKEKYIQIVKQDLMTVYTKFSNKSIPINDVLFKKILRLKQYKKSLLKIFQGSNPKTVEKFLKNIFEIKKKLTSNQFNEYIDRLTQIKRVITEFLKEDNQKMNVFKKFAFEQILVISNLLEKKTKKGTSKINLFITKLRNQLFENSQTKEYIFQTNQNSNHYCQIQIPLSDEEYSFNSNCQHRLHYHINNSLQNYQPFYFQNNTQL